MIVLGLQCFLGFPLVVPSGGYYLDELQGLLTAMTSLVPEHGLWGAQASVPVAHRLNSCGSRDLEHRLNRCGT